MATIGTAGLLVGAVVAAAAFWPNTGDKLNIPYDTGTVALTPTPHEVTPTEVDIVAARAVAARFIQTALAREHLDESFDLASPGMKQGMSRKEWESGNIPVPTYPLEAIGKAREKLDFSFKDDIAFDVLVEPKPTAKVRPAVFTAELKAYGHGLTRHWLVDSWQPNGVAESSSASGGGPAAPLRAKAALSPAYLLIPLAILSLIVFIPVGFGIRSWRHGRRAARAYTSSSRPS